MQVLRMPMIALLMDKVHNFFFPFYVSIRKNLLDLSMSIFFKFIFSLEILSVLGIIKELDYLRVKTYSATS